MSTLSVSNITDGTDTVETGYVVNGSAKAWVDLTGSGTVTVNESLNISSVADGGTGDYTFTFTNSPASDKYSINATGNQARASTAWGYEAYPRYQLTASLRIICATTGYTQTDLDPACIQIWGDLA